jgi:hypothetical protein
VQSSQKEKASKERTKRSIIAYNRNFNHAVKKEMPGRPKICFLWEELFFPFLQTFFENPIMEENSLARSHGDSMSEISRNWRDLFLPGARVQLLFNCSNSGVLDIQDTA